MKEGLHLMDVKIMELSFFYDIDNT